MTNTKAINALLKKMTVTEMTQELFTFRNAQLNRGYPDGQFNGANANKFETYKKIVLAWTPKSVAKEYLETFSMAIA